MEMQTAIHVLRALADGIDPATGEMMPTDSPYQRADTVRALYAALAALDRQHKLDSRKRTLPENAGKAWNENEDMQVANAFESGHSVSAIARTHGRTVGAIHSRLVKLGKIIEPSANA